MSTAIEPERSRTSTRLNSLWQRGGDGGESGGEGGVGGAGAEGGLGGPQYTCT